MLTKAITSNTPTLAAMLRVSRDFYNIARKHLYHTVELGFRGDPNSGNNFMRIISGFLEGSQTKAECLAMVHTVFVNGKIIYPFPREKPDVFPNLRVVVFPDVCKTNPEIFTPYVFRFAQHIVLRSGPETMYVVDWLSFNGGAPDIAGWTQLRKVTFYNLSARVNSRRAQDRRLGTIPQALFTDLDEIEIWPAFKDTERDPALNPFLNMLRGRSSVKGVNCTIVVPAGFEEEYVKVYGDEYDKLSKQERAVAHLHFRVAKSKIAAKVDPVLQEYRSFREWQ